MTDHFGDHGEPCVVKLDNANDILKEYEETKVVVWYSRKICIKFNLCVMMFESNQTHSRRLECPPLVFTLHKDTRQ